MVGIADSALISLESCIQSVLYREISLYSFYKFYSNTLFADPAIGRMGASNRKHKRLEPKHGKQLSTLSSRHVSGTEVDYYFAH